MISVEEAIFKVENNYEVLPTEEVYLKDARNKILAKDIVSPINMPPFRQSAMDGYAVNFDPNIESYTIVDEIQAGMDPDNYELKKGQSVRIFTGAALPNGSTSVIQQEWCIRTNNSLSFNKRPLDQLNIRPIGEQLIEGEKVLKKGHQINPATIGLIAGLGIEKVTVYKEPNIAIIITGDELIQPGNKLTNGKIYESNSRMLIAVLHQFGYQNITTFYAKDNYKETVFLPKTELQFFCENDDVMI